MKCEACGSPMFDTEAICARCGYLRTSSPFVMRCKTCGNHIPNTAAICKWCRTLTNSPFVQRISDVDSRPRGSYVKYRNVYVVLGIFLGVFGIHNFYAGYIRKAVIQLFITVCFGWLLLPLFAVAFWAGWEAVTVRKDAQGVYFS